MCFLRTKMVYILKLYKIYLIKNQKVYILTIGDVGFDNRDTTFDKDPGKNTKF